MSTTTDSAASPPNKAEEAEDVCGFYVWGANEFGNLGLGHVENEFLPIRIKNQGAAGEDEGILVGCGGFHLVLATKNGDVFATGRNDDNQLGVMLEDDEGESETKVTVPVLIDLPLQNITIDKICCGFAHTLLLSTSNTSKLFAFGNNARGECGVNSTQPVITRPTLVEPISKRISIVDLASKGFHSLLLMEDGTVAGFGSNDCFQLGLAAEEEVVLKPTLLPLRDRCKKIACGVYHSAIVDNKDVIWVFGDNSFAQLAQVDMEEHLPIPLDFALPVLKLSCGFAHTMLLTQAHEVWAWGSNGNGQLGLGHFDPVVLFPTLVEALAAEKEHRVTQIECGYNTSFFWVETQGLFACGTNENGELGIGSGLPDQCLPVRVLGVPVPSSSSSRAMTPTILASNFTVLLPPPRTPGACSSSTTMQHEGESTPRRATTPSQAADKSLSPTSRNKRRFSPEAATKHYYSHSLSEDLGRLLAHNSAGTEEIINCSMISDVTLQASADRGLFPVNKAIITARCARLGKVIRAKVGNSETTTDSTPTVLLPKLTSDTLRRLLVFLYTGLVQIGDASLSEILLLASCAQTLLAEELFAACVLEIKSLLTDENVILVLREACELALLCVKRACMEYIIQHFSACVSSRNRQVVETLGNNPELLSEVVGLSSPDFANRLIRNLPTTLTEDAVSSSLERDLQGLFESEEFADVCFQCQEENEDFSMLCHRVILIARCPFFAASFQALYLLKEDGDAAAVSMEDRKRVQLVFGFPEAAQTADAEGRTLVREINRSSSGALKCFLLYLYTDRVDTVKQDVAFDVLQMACIYGLAASPLAMECEEMMKQHINANNALDTLCIAKQLGRQELLGFALEYIVENFVDCVASEDTLRDSLFDFPQLGVDLLMAVGARLRENKAEAKLKRPSAA